MYTIPPKKMLIINILDILKRYTDADHRLSQKEITDILAKEYSMKVDRRAVKRNLMNLIEFGYNIEYSESIRMVKNKDGTEEETSLLSDFYLSRDFTEGELRLLIDSLLFSKHIPYSQCKELIRKLEGLSNIYFKSRVKHIMTFPEDQTDNKQLFLNIELLDEAISKKRQVSFRYLEYGTDKKMHPRKAAGGNERLYVINPYQMAAKEGKYYLICNYDKYDNISNYRLDRITDLKVLDTRAKPFESLKGADNKSLDLYRYMTEHVYMFSSKNVHAKFRITRPMISDVIDMFGKDVRFSDETDTHVTVSVNVNEMAMHQFAKTYAPDVVVLEPQSLADEVKESLEKSLQAYNQI